MTLPSENNILIVEDNDADFFLIRRALNRAAPDLVIRRCRDGDEALDYLYRRNGYADPASAPRPGVALLDLNLPGTEGHEVLRIIKADAALRSLPVIILSGSDRREDIDQCYAAGGNCYVRKRLNHNGLATAVEQIVGYWLRLASLPVIA